MKYIFDRIRNGKDTVKDPLYDNPYSYGKIERDDALCTCCGKCEKQCIAKAIKLEENKPIFDYRKCIYCRDCIYICESKALKMSSDYKTSILDISKEDMNIMSEVLRERIYGKFKHSLVLRSVDTGSCNACLLEMSALSNTYYDISRYGISFSASPRHADGIIVTGPVTINMRDALIKTYEALSEPKLVIAIGACSEDGGIYKDCYGVIEPLHKIIPVNIYIPGCPPSPQAMIYGLLKTMDKLD